MIKISVITAVYNCESTVGQAIESVLAQSYPAVESVVIDGGSTDGTLAVLKHYHQRLSVLISERDQGIYDALNKGIGLAIGDVIGFLHADDVFESNLVLAKVAAAFEDSSIDAVYGDLVYVRHNDIAHVIRYWKSGSYDVAALRCGWMPPHPTLYVRRAVYERLGRFNTRYRISADYDTVLRFLLIGKIRATYIPEILVRMRTGGVSNRSLKTIVRKSLEDIQVLRGNRVGWMTALALKNLRKLSQFFRLKVTQLQYEDRTIKTNESGAIRVFNSLERIPKLQKWVVAGGCHVNGFPVGFTNGFSQVAAKLCNSSIVNEVSLSAIHLEHAHRVVEVCDGIKPNILILQMGHFETTKRLFRSSDQWATLLGEVRPSGGPMINPNELFMNPAQTLMWDVMNLLKLVLWQVLGEDHFDVSAFKGKLKTFASEIMGMNIPKVILLSPFPCADRVTLRHRRKILKLFQTEAERSGFIYLDVMSKTLAAAKGKDMYFDAIHMNQKGHAFIGHLVADCILSLSVKPVGVNAG
jgi:glycosyltransferase involved in cell wall biosynthesis